MPSAPNPDSPGLPRVPEGRLQRRPRAAAPLARGEPRIEIENELFPAIPAAVDVGSAAAELSMHIDDARARKSTPELRRHERCCSPSPATDGAADGDARLSGMLNRRPRPPGVTPIAGASSNSTSTFSGAGDGPPRRAEVAAELAGAAAATSSAPRKSASLSIGREAGLGRPEGCSCSAELCSKRATGRRASYFEPPVRLHTTPHAPERGETSSGGRSTGSSTVAARGSAPTRRAGRGRPCWD